MPSRSSPCRSALASGDLWCLVACLDDHGARDAVAQVVANPGSVSALHEAAEECRGSSARGGNAPREGAVLRVDLNCAVVRSDGNAVCFTDENGVARAIEHGAATDEAHA